MADIFDEIEEDLRRDRMKELWQRYGNYILVLALLIIVGVAGNQGYDYWVKTKSQVSGNIFFEALTAENSLDALNDAVSHLPDGYAMLARFRMAALYAEDGNSSAAEKSYLELSEDTSINSFYRDIALLLSVMNAPSSLDKNMLIERISDISGFAGPLQGLALEKKAGLHLELNEVDMAISSLTLASELSDIPPSLRQRVAQSLAIISKKYTDRSSVVLQ